MADDWKGPPIETAKKFQTLMFKYFIGAKEAEKTGQPVAWVTSGGPVEILQAAGVVPVYPEQHAALCGSQKVATDLCMVAEQHGYSPDLCSYVRTDLGAIFSGESPIGGLPKPDFLLCANNICGTVTKWYQILARHFDVPLILIDIPFQHDGVDPDAVEYVRRQLVDAYDRVGELIGKPIDMDEYIETVKRAARAASLWQDLLDLLENVPSPMTSFDTFVHMAPIVVLRGTDECIEYYEELNAEIKQRVADGVAAVPGERFRLGWDNIPIWFQLRGLSKKFAMNRVCLAVATYTNSWGGYGFTATPDDLFQAMAEQYTDVFINSGPETRLKELLEMVERYSLDGIVMHSDRSCRTYSFGQYDLAATLRNDHGIPTLILEADMNDTRVYAEEQVNTRIDAFIETLEANA